MKTNIRKIRWPRDKWRPHNRLDKSLHAVDHALTKWAVWLQLYAKNRGFSMEQARGMMSGSSARARWVPKQQQWVDLAVSALARFSPRLVKVLWLQYVEKLPPEDAANALHVDLRTYTSALSAARHAIANALFVMESRDLTERALYIRDKREKNA
jgi:predicted DNA-binding protein (UPF0251 family)